MPYIELSRWRVINATLMKDPSESCRRRAAFHLYRRSPDARSHSIFYLRSRTCAPLFTFFRVCCCYVFPRDTLSPPLFLDEEKKNVDALLYKRARRVCSYYIYIQ